MEDVAAAGQPGAQETPEPVKGHMLMKAPAPPASDCDGEDPSEMLADLYSEKFPGAAQGGWHDGRDMGATSSTAMPDQSTMYTTAGTVGWSAGFGGDNSMLDSAMSFAHFPETSRVGPGDACSSHSPSVSGSSSVSAAGSRPLSAQSNLSQQVPLSRPHSASFVSGTLPKVSEDRQQFSQSFVIAKTPTSRPSSGRPRSAGTSLEQAGANFEDKVAESVVEDDAEAEEASAVRKLFSEDGQDEAERPLSSQVADFVLGVDGGLGDMPADRMESKVSIVEAPSEAHGPGSEVSHAYLTSRVFEHLLGSTSPRQETVRSDSKAATDRGAAELAEEEQRLAARVKEEVAKMAEEVRQRVRDEVANQGLEAAEVDTREQAELTAFCQNLRQDLLQAESNGSLSAVLQDAHRRVGALQVGAPSAAESDAEPEPTAAWAAEQFVSRVSEELSSARGTEQPEAAGDKEAEAQDFSQLCRLLCHDLQRAEESGQMADVMAEAMRKQMADLKSSEAQLREDVAAKEAAAAERIRALEAEVAAGKAAMEQLRTELSSAEAPAAAFDSFDAADANGDGVITREEWDRRLVAQGSQPSSAPTLAPSAGGSRPGSADSRQMATALLTGILGEPDEEVAHDGPQDPPRQLGVGFLAPVDAAAVDDSAEVVRNILKKNLAESAAKKALELNEASAAARSVLDRASRGPAAEEAAAAVAAQALENGILRLSLDEAALQRSATKNTVVTVAESEPSSAEDLCRDAVSGLGVQAAGPPPASRAARPASGLSRPMSGMSVKSGGSVASARAREFAADLVETVAILGGAETQTLVSEAQTVAHTAQSLSEAGAQKLTTDLAGRAAAAADRHEALSHISEAQLSVGAAEHYATGLLADADANADAGEDAKSEAMVSHADEAVAGLVRGLGPRLRHDEDGALIVSLTPSPSKEAPGEAFSREALAAAAGAFGAEAEAFERARAASKAAVQDVFPSGASELGEDEDEAFASQAVAGMAREAVIGAAVEDIIVDYASSAGTAIAMDPVDLRGLAPASSAGVESVAGSEVPRSVSKVSDGLSFDHVGSQVANGAVDQAMANLGWASRPSSGRPSRPTSGKPPRPHSGARRPLSGKLPLSLPESRYVSPAKTAAGLTPERLASEMISGHLPRLAAANVEDEDSMVDAASLAPSSRLNFDYETGTGASSEAVCERMLEFGSIDGRSVVLDGEGVDVRNFVPPLDLVRTRQAGRFIHATPLDTPVSSFHASQQQSVRSLFEASLEEQMISMSLLSDAALLGEEQEAGFAYLDAALAARGAALLEDEAWDAALTPPMTPPGASPRGGGLVSDAIEMDRGSPETVGSGDGDDDGLLGEASLVRGSVSKSSADAEEMALDSVRLISDAVLSDIGAGEGAASLPFWSASASEVASDARSYADAEGAANDSVRLISDAVLSDIGAGEDAASLAEAGGSGAASEVASEARSYAAAEGAARDAVRLLSSGAAEVDRGPPATPGSAAGDAETVVSLARSYEGAQEAARDVVRESLAKTKSYEEDQEAARDSVRLISDAVLSDIGAGEGAASLAEASVVGAGEGAGAEESALQVARTPPGTPPRASPRGDGGGGLVSDAIELDQGPPAPPAARRGEGEEEASLAKGSQSSAGAEDVSSLVRVRVASEDEASLVVSRPGSATGGGLVSDAIEMDQGPPAPPPPLAGERPKAAGEDEESLAKSSLAAAGAPPPPLAGERPKATDEDEDSLAKSSLAAEGAPPPPLAGERPKVASEDEASLAKSSLAAEAPPPLAGERPKAASEDEESLAKSSLAAEAPPPLAEQAPAKSSAGEAAQSRGWWAGPSVYSNFQLKLESFANPVAARLDQLNATGLMSDARLDQLNATGGALMSDAARGAAGGSLISDAIEIEQGPPAPPPPPPAARSKTEEEDAGLAKSSAGPEGAPPLPPPALRTKADGKEEEASQSKSSGVRFKDEEEEDLPKSSVGPEGAPPPPPPGARAKADGEEEEEALSKSSVGPEGAPPLPPPLAGERPKDAGEEEESLAKSSVGPEGAPPLPPPLAGERSEAADEDEDTLAKSSLTAEAPPPLAGERSKAAEEDEDPESKSVPSLGDVESEGRKHGAEGPESARSGGADMEELLVANLDLDPSAPALQSDGATSVHGPFEDGVAEELMGKHGLEDGQVESEKITVRKLPSGWLASNLLELCNQYGVVEGVRQDKKDGSFTVAFQSSEAARQAVEALQGSQLEGQAAAVECAFAPPPAPEPEAPESTTVRLGRLPSDLREAQVQEICSQCGVVGEVQKSEADGSWTVALESNEMARGAIGALMGMWQDMPRDSKWAWMSPPEVDLAPPPPPEPEIVTVCVKDWPKDMPLAELEELCDDFGEVEGIKPSAEGDGSFTVSFRTPEMAKLAMEALSGMPVMGKGTLVCELGPPPEPETHEGRICVRRLPSGWVASNLLELCSSYGVVEGLWPEAEDGSYTVDFQDQEAAMEAQEALQGLLIDGQGLECNLGDLSAAGTPTGGGSVASLGEESKEPEKERIKITPKVSSDAFEGRFVLKKKEAAPKEEPPEEEIVKKEKPVVVKVVKDKWARNKAEATLRSYGKMDPEAVHWMDAPILARPAPSPKQKEPSAKSLGLEPRRLPPLVGMTPEKAALEAKRAVKLVGHRATGVPPCYQHYRETTPAMELDLAHQSPEVKAAKAKKSRNLAYQGTICSPSSTFTSWDPVWDGHHTRNEITVASPPRARRATRGSPGHAQLADRARPASTGRLEPVFEETLSPTGSPKLAGSQSAPALPACGPPAAALAPYRRSPPGHSRSRSLKSSAKSKNKDLAGIEMLKMLHSGSLPSLLYPPPA